MYSWPNLVIKCIWRAVVVVCSALCYFYSPGHRTLGGPNPWRQLAIPMTESSIHTEAGVRMLPGLALNGGLTSMSLQLRYCASQIKAEVSELTFRGDETPAEPRPAAAGSLCFNAKST